MVALSLPETLIDMYGKIIKIGNSKGVIIPSSLLKELSLGEKDEVKFRLENNTLVITKQEPYTGPFTGPFADLPRPAPGEPDPWGDMSGEEWEDMLRRGSSARSIDWD